MVNHEATCDRLDLWLTFEVTEGDRVFVQMGVPRLERLDTYDLGGALFGPGELADGRRVRPLAERRPFTDVESDTDSWIYYETELEIRETGTYYLVAWPTDWQTGKFWVSVGTEERFTRDDFRMFPVWIDQMQEFYEVDGQVGVVEGCAPDASADSLPEPLPPIESPVAGCAAADAPVGWIPLALTLGALLLTSRRRRRWTD